MHRIFLETVKGWKRMNDNPYMYPYGNQYQYQYPYAVNVPMYHDGRQPVYWAFPNAVEYANGVDASRFSNNVMLKDYGPNPFVVNINEATKQNKTYRTALWTGSHLQLTLMSIQVGGDIGLEMHPDVDQFLRIEQGQGLVRMGKRKDNLNFERNVYDDSAIFIPAGTWHNLTNTGNVPLKLYSIYAPPNHPFGTVHVTKEEAMAMEEGHHGNENTAVFGKTPDQWVEHTKFLVKEGLEDVKRGVNARHILQEFILMGVLVGKGYTPEKAYKTVEDWERTGESKLLQQSKKM